MNLCRFEADSFIWPRIRVRWVEGLAGGVEGDRHGSVVDELDAHVSAKDPRGDLGSPRTEALGDGIADATVAISHDLREPEAQRKPSAWYERQRQKIERGLAVMERDLGDREFCHGAGFSLADIAAGFALAYLDQVLKDVDWRRDFPQLKKLAARLATRESFAATAPAV